MNRHIDIEAEHLEATGFNGEGHMHNFFHYLFRTDTKQKWTNKMTGENLYFYYDAEINKVIKGSFGDLLEERREIKRKYYKGIMPFLRSNPSAKLINDILYFETKHLDEIKGLVVQFMGLSTIKVIVC